MLPLTWEALATGANGLLGFIGSKYSADKSYKAQLAANEANLQAVRETNQANYKTWQEYANMQKSLAGDSNQLQRELLNAQQAFNASEAVKSRAFNSASAQVQRLLDAGLNPHGANAGSSESVASSGLGSPVTPSISVPPNFIAGRVSPAADVGVGKGLEALSSVLGMSAQLSNQRQISKYDVDARTSQQNIENVIKAQHEQWSEETTRLGLENQKKLNESLINSANAQVDKLSQETIYQELLNKNFDRTLASSLHVDAAKADNLIRSVNAQYAEMANTMSMFLTREGNVNWQFKERLANDIINFDKQLSLEGERLGLSKEQLELAKYEYVAEHGGFLAQLSDKVGLKRFADSLGSLAGGVLNFFGFRYLAKHGGLPPSKVTTERRLNYGDGVSTVHRNESYYR